MISNEYLKNSGKTWLESGYDISITNLNRTITFKSEIKIHQRTCATVTFNVEICSIVYIWSILCKDCQYICNKAMSTCSNFYNLIWTFSAFDKFLNK